MAKAKAEISNETEEKVEKTETVQVPRWQELQQQQIQKAIELIKTHGQDVEFLVIKDRMFMRETINPLVNIDTAMNFLYRLEGRGITSANITKFKKEYLSMVEKIKKVEETAVEMLAKTSTRTDNRFLNRKIVQERRKNNKK